MTAPRIEGVRETLAALKDFDPKLRRATDRTIRKAAQPLKSAAQSKIPGQALSGWSSGRYAFDGANARAGVRLKLGGGVSKRVARSTSTWPLLTMSQSNAGGSVFDMAGRRSSGNSPQGIAFISALNARFGGASRSMWPAAEEKLPEVQASVASAVDEAAAQINRQLRRR